MLMTYRNNESSQKKANLFLYKKINICSDSMFSQVPACMGKVFSINILTNQMNFIYEVGKKVYKREA